MNIETKLALDVLAESKNNLHQRRYNAVVKFIQVFGIIPSFERILRDLPKSEIIIKNVCLPENLTDQINHHEKNLQLNPGNQEIINELDKLYDSYYRQTNSK